MPDVFFTVDPDGLEALRSQLEHIQSGMRDTGNAVDAYSPLDLGPDNAVWNALQAFQVGWSSGLAKIGQNLTALETLLGKAAADYRDTDRQIAQAATQPGTQLS
jgi:uncharacterized protein YukE